MPNVQVVLGFPDGSTRTSDIVEATPEDLDLVRRQFAMLKSLTSITMEISGKEYIYNPDHVLWAHVKVNE